MNKNIKIAKQLVKLAKSLMASEDNAFIEQITGDNRRPGMPQTGWLVRYEPTQFGWKKMKCFKDYEEAIKFFDQKNK